MDDFVNTYHPPQWMHVFAALCERVAADHAARQPRAVAAQPLPAPTLAELRAQLVAASVGYCVNDAYADDYGTWSRWRDQRRLIGELRQRIAALESAQ
jgi:hypothetical protein